MKDPDIRDILRRTELSQYIGDLHSRVVEELKLPVAGARVDMAVINGHLHGFEIKSASDSLKRLSDQISAYEKVFDFVTVVTEPRHTEKVRYSIPQWVGLKVCHEDGQLETSQLGGLNKNKQSFYVAKLLRRDELIKVLKTNNVPYARSHGHWLLCETLANNLDSNLLSDSVREILKGRTNWKD